MENIATQCHLNGKAEISSKLQVSSESTVVETIV
jgi:hypothetical protein